MTKISKSVYGMPVLGRVGLAHSLMAWARCQIWCEENGYRYVAPYWFKIRIGPFLRRERDKRLYFLLFTAGEGLSGLARIWAIIRTKKIDVFQEKPVLPATLDATMVRFRNLITDNAADFAVLLPHATFLRDRLIGMTRPRYLPTARPHAFVAMHIRLGDFVRSSTDKELHTGMTNSVTPIQWFSSRLEAVRATLGFEAPAVIFSDGTDEELSDVLNLAGVVRSDKRHSITDMLDMSTAGVLISSGSGFSIWGAFLGQVPRICHPGQRLVQTQTLAEAEIESGIGDTLPASFVDIIQRRFTKSGEPLETI